MGVIRRLPAQDVRVETGVIRFGNDRPGYFIRGDNAGGRATILRTMAAEMLEMAAELEKVKDA